ncbi:14351_t:CDS:1, partial [Acaulospora colombiana]
MINEEHVAEISSWINRKETTYSEIDIPYKFKLILRGSRDGFNPQTFWNLCHGMQRTVTVLRVAGTDEILGGYNPLIWDKTTDGIWMKSNDCFIFSLKNYKMRNSILSRVKVNNNAIYNPIWSVQDKYGP